MLGSSAAPRESEPADDWGVTRIPAWLDTAAGRRAWAGRAGSGQEPGSADPEDHGPGDPGPGAGGLDGGEFDGGELDGGDFGDEDFDDDGSGEEAWDGQDWDEVLDDRRHDDAAFGDGGDDEPGGGGEPDGDDPDDDWHAPPRRFAMLPSAAIGLIGVGVIACVIAAFSLLRGTEPAAPLVDLPASAGPTAPGVAASHPSAAADPSAAPAPAAEIVVSVAGLVRKPGLVRLAPNSRVAQALDSAGGAAPTADLLSLNMAQILHDGDQVLVGTREAGAGSVRSAVVSSAGSGAPGSGGAGSAGTGTAGPAGGAKVDLNTATMTELDALPGVGPVTAQAIISWREQHGGFTSVDQLAEVNGIGPGKLAKLRDAVTVGP
ncbi:putative competence protein ComEA [Gordonia hirsuta DSM 44140 = NBRC 16056]|uniref:Putative competence protein ComEA n=1 Tax=Gordonia hirsuta DSM 44140 = NBRC 16056 TaxID=1121927 RepID=L7L8X8_9ACTN|nr:putative competence protein ComEA [Gordonia hirsuta DSM 44140 = NBRC 16056]